MSVDITLMVGTITISINQQTKTKLDELAHELGLSRSSMIRMLILQRVKQEGKQ